jgi:hypothetical protein
MHTYEMRAEYGSDEAIKQWHMITNDGTTALCGVELSPDAEKQSDAAWSHTHEKFCHTCGALYLRQVP